MSDNPDAAPVQSEHPHGPPYDRETLGPVVGAAFVRLCGGDVDAARKMSDTIRERCGGYTPEQVALAIVDAADPPINVAPVPDVEAPEVG